MPKVQHPAGSLPVSNYPSLDSSIRPETVRVDGGWHLVLSSVSEMVSLTCQLDVFLCVVNLFFVYL